MLRPVLLYVVTLVWKSQMAEDRLEHCYVLVEGLNATQNKPLGHRFLHVPY